MRVYRSFLETGNPANLIDLVKKSSFNYFEITEHYSVPYSELVRMVSPELSRSELEQLQISYEVYCCDENLYSELKQREANAVNGEIVTDSESDDTEKVLQVNNVLDEEMKQLIKKKQDSIKRQVVRLKAKRIAETNLLSRKVSR